MKIIANSTSYGIFIEVNRDDAPKSEPLHVFGPDGACLATRTTAIEEPGRYYHPLLGVLITGAARLMLAIAERLTMDAGLDWAFCDTDSLAMLRPRKMARRTFRQRVQRVIDWYVPLNPYRKPGSILKVEDINYRPRTKRFEPLYCLAISAKRYVLFNLDDDGTPILRKASAHGLGHLMDPYMEDDALGWLPQPRVPLQEIGVRRWQHDLWGRIIRAALDGTPDQVALDWHPALFTAARSRYSASSPNLLKWMDRWNEGRAYREQVRPFGFLLSYTARARAPSLLAEDESTVGRIGPGRPPKRDIPKPTAPYESGRRDLASNVFDRATGKPIGSE